MKKIIKKLFYKDKKTEEFRMQDFFKKKMDKSKESWDSFVSIAKREGKETKEMIKIISEILKEGDAKPEEIKFIKEQSKDLIKIVAIMSMGAVSMVIPITLEKILNKYGISILPKSNKKD